MQRSISIAVLSALALPALAQSSPLYFSQFVDSNTPSKGVIFQNGATQSTFNHVGASRQYAMAIADDIRTVDYFGSGLGGGYDLNGVSLGTTFSHNSPNSDALVDGTTNGVDRNFAGGYFSTNVYGYDRDWGNVQTLFSVPDAARISGIAYDTGNGSLWIYGSDTGSIRQYSLTGNLLSSFNISPGVSDVFLAFESSTQTIWAYPRESQVLIQYSRSGELLGRTVTDFSGSVIGMEFAVPAPGAAGLLGVAGLATARRRRA